MQDRTDTLAGSHRQAKRPSHRRASRIAPTGEAPTAPHDFGYVIRTAGDPTALVAEIRSALAQIDRELPLFDVRTMSERSELTLLAPTSTMQLATLFAGVAVFLSAIGAANVDVMRILSAP